MVFFKYLWFMRMEEMQTEVFGKKKKARVQTMDFVVIFSILLQMVQWHNCRQVLYGFIDKPEYTA